MTHTEMWATVQSVALAGAVVGAVVVLFRLVARFVKR